MPIPDVVLELRDGITGEPISGSAALPGTYGEGPIRTRTDADGYYEFRGLPRGNYSVYEIQPDGYEDGLDTPGTTSGIAINPGDELAEAALQTLSTDPRNDAIVRIPLAAGGRVGEQQFQRAGPASGSTRTTRASRRRNRRGRPPCRSCRRRPPGCWSCRRWSHPR